MSYFFRSNADYRLVGEFDGVCLYVPVDLTNYHLRRRIEMEKVQLYAASGATQEVLRESINAIIDNLNNTGTNDHRVTNVGAICNMLLYRLDYPVDEHASFRMGVSVVFAEWEENGVVYSEKTDDIQPLFFDKKINLGMLNGDAYAFFLTLGVSNIKGYVEQLNQSESEGYWERRREAIRSFLPKEMRGGILTV